MLSPDFLEHIPDSMIELSAQAERDILADIARRLSTYNYWIPSAEWQVKKLEAMGMVRADILKHLERMTDISQKELKRLMEEAAVTTMKSDDEVYRRAGLSPLPLQADIALLQVLEAGWRKTNKQFTNLTKTTANTVTKQFEDALDRAHMMIISGAFDQNTAVRLCIKDLARQSIKFIVYPSGHEDTLEVAVLRAVRTGINQTCAELQKARAVEMGCDLVEVTAHAGARPSHAAWQGRIYSWSGQSDTYPPFEDSTGYGTGPGLCGWNCRHSFFPFFDGISQPAYSPETLKEMEAKNYEYNDKKMTEYEATQKQRYIERQIRRWKRQEAAGVDVDQARAETAHWQRTQKDFLKQTGLKRQWDREQIGKVVAKSRESGIIKTGAVSGARNPYGGAAKEHAQKYYGLVRSMKTDVSKIAKTTGYAESEIQDIKNFIFMNKHDLGGVKPEFFEPDFMMAESWKRLMDGRPEVHDFTLLNHEMMEKSLMEQGLGQSEAHKLTSEKYNYAKEADEFYGKISKYKKE